MCLQMHEFLELKDMAVDEIYRFSNDEDVLNGYGSYAVHDRWTGFKGLCTELLTDDTPFGRCATFAQSV
jgi:hypothetical protein